MAHTDLLAVAIGRGVRLALVSREAEIGDIAEKIGIARNSMSRRINGHVPFTWPELVRVADALDMELSELLEFGDREAAKVAAATDSPAPCDMSTDPTPAGSAA